MTPRRPHWTGPGGRPAGRSADDLRASGVRTGWFTRLLRGRATAEAAEDDAFAAVLDSVLKLPAELRVADESLGRSICEASRGNSADDVPSLGGASLADGEQVDAVMRRLGFLRDRAGGKRHRHWRLLRRGGMLGMLLAIAGLGIVLHNAQPGSVRPASVTVPNAVEAGVGRGADRLGDVLRTLHRLQPPSGAAPSRSPEADAPAPRPSAPARATAPFRWV